MAALPWRRFRHEVVSSTNDLAFAAIEAGSARHGDTFVAGTQTAGRGTRGRTWESAPGGLYLSVVLRSTSMPPPGAWTCAGALAVHDVARSVGAPAVIKWPNDVTTPGGAKIAGVLAESRGLRANAPTAFVLGVGLNVTGAGPSGALRAERAVASLDELSPAPAPLDLASVEEALVETLERRTREVIEDASLLFSEFFERCALAHARVTVEGAEQEVTGSWTGLDPFLGLRIDAAGRARHLPVAHVRSVLPAD
ncbi:MAG: biotin--[acetyl-CoA-carboxylase] ligase [Planctomycetota bacterium]|nr:biotin--[acetyl-CoA-carboxylase] ligase [Planctomycetota bacterium]